MESLSVPQEDSVGANPSSVKSEDSSPRPEGGRDSPPPNCAICLGQCRNKSFTDSCLHQFCFKCLLTWSKVKAVCPLCKQNFKSIIHNVRSNHQYEEYLVEQREETVESAVMVTERDIDDFATATRRFRYRTTLTLPRRETLAIQQLLLHYPLLTTRAPPPAPFAHRRRREPAAFRRTVYRHNLWARPLPDFTGRFRDCTPDFYRYNDSQMHRLVPWLSRELSYLLNDNAGHISYVLARILELLPQHHVNSPEFREAMRRYLGERTEHFLHELYCFASTPYDMTGYDRNVQYTTDSRISTMVNEIISSSDSDASVDSDIVMVSSSGPEPPPGPSRAPVYPNRYIPPPAPAPAPDVVPIETVSQSDTDDDSDSVMVVGYIKPPQERTPEVVDLLGSDSDVIVQENPQPETSRPPVKLILKRHRARSSDSDVSYRPVPARTRRYDSATTCDTSRATPDSSRHTPDSVRDLSSPAPADLSVPPRSWSDSDSGSGWSTGSSEKRKPPKKRARRKPRKESARKDKRRSRKRSRSGSSHRQDRSSTTEAERDRRSKKKSHSGKGVKSSQAAVESTTTDAVALDRPGPSGEGSVRERRRRRSSRDTRRLRSVVNVINGSTCSSSSPSVSGAGAELPAPDAMPAPWTDDTDPEDNIPLNLTIQKSLSPR